MIEEIKTRLSEAIYDHVFPGCVVGVVRASGERTIIPVGRHTYESDSAPITETSIFDAASLTKAIPTSSLALKLIEEGKLRLQDKVMDYLPELQNNYRDQILVWHLLTFTILLDLKHPLASYKHSSPEDVLRVIFTTDLKFPPGSTYQYSNTPAILLGLIVEKVYGKSLPNLAKEIFFNPLEMKDSTFSPRDIGRVVPTEIDPDRGGLLRGVVHDESTYALQKSFFPGSAGLFTTVPDLLNFLEMLLHSGTLQNRQYFKKETVALMHTNQIANLGQSTGVGWELNQPRYMGRFAHEHMFGKTGFTGCVVVIDNQRGLAFTLLSNFVHPKRHPSAEPINKVRADIADIIFKPEHSSSYS